MYIVVAESEVQQVTSLILKDIFFSNTSHRCTPTIPARTNLKVSRSPIVHLKVFFLQGVLFVPKCISILLGCILEAMCIAQYVMSLLSTDVMKYIYLIPELS